MDNINGIDGSGGPLQPIPTTALLPGFVVRPSGKGLVPYPPLQAGDVSRSTFDWCRQLTAIVDGGLWCALALCLC